MHNEFYKKSKSVTSSATNADMTYLNTFLWDNYALKQFTKRAQLNKEWLTESIQQVKALSYVHLWHNPLHQDYCLKQ
jgi:hypothetical protein